MFISLDIPKTVSGNISVSLTCFVSFSGDEYYEKLTADFLGPQSGEGLELETTPHKNKILVQVGLLKEENNFPWISILEWLKKIFPSHRTSNFRRLIERGIATTLSLGGEARQNFLESDINFNFIGPILDSIGVQRDHLLEMRDFSVQAQSIEVTNGLILELSNFVNREQIAPVVLVAWLKNFNPEFCKDGDFHKAYKVLRPKIKKLKMSYRNHETRSHRRNPAMEALLHSPFEIVPKRKRPFGKKRMRKDHDLDYEKVIVKEEYESDEVTQSNAPKRCRVDGHKTQDKPQTLSLLDLTMLSVQKLSRVYDGKTVSCKQFSSVLLTNQFTLTCKVHPAMAAFEEKLKALPEDLSLASPVEFLNCNAHFLVDIHDAVEQQLMSFEEEIVQSTGKKLGRDALPKFKSFVNFSESATSRYIHMVSNILSSRNAVSNYRKHWVAFCKEKRNPSTLAANEPNRFNSCFESAAGLIHHHKEIGLFFSDLLSMDNEECPNIIVESVAADAEDTVIQSLVCAMAIVHCKVLGPYWQLLNSEGQYSSFGQYLLGLYQKFLDWSKDPSTLLEPEEGMNVFLQDPLHEKIYNGVFQYCGQWHTDRELIRGCLKKMIKVISSVTEKHLKDFLPGGKLAPTLPLDVRSQLKSCTFSVLMADYPFNSEEESSAKPCKRPPPRSLLRADGDSLSSSSDSSATEWREEAHRADRNSRYQELMQNTDLTYITDTVKKNGGPCKTQQDVDKMLLRFDGKPRIDRWEAMRCELLYQKMVLSNENLDSSITNVTQMSIKLKLALPRIKPGFSLVLTPRKTALKAAAVSRKKTTEGAEGKK